MNIKLELDKLLIDEHVLISLYFNLYRAVKNHVIFTYGFCFCMGYNNVFFFVESCQLLFENKLSDKTLILTIFILTMNAFVVCMEKIRTQLRKQYDLFRLAFIFFLNCKNYQKSTNDSQNLPSHGFRVPSDSKSPSETIIVTKNRSRCDSSHSHQRTIQKITLHTFLRDKFVREFFTKKFIFMIIKKIFFDNLYNHKIHYSIHMLWV